MRHVSGFWPFFLLLAAMLLEVAPACARPMEPRHVRTGVFITSISDLEPADGSFRLTGYIWFIDPQARFDPGRDFRILARTLAVTAVEQDILPDGSSYSAAYFDAVIDMQFDVTRYPFDQQLLRLVISSRVEVTDLTFDADSMDSGIADVVEVPGWVVGDLRLAASLKSYTTGFGHQTARPAFPRLTVQIEVERKRSPLIFEKFTGFLVSLVISGLVFAVPAEQLGTRLGMLTSSIFAAVFNLNRLEDAIGFDASFGLVDQISLITFGAMLGSLSISLYVHRLSDARRGAEAARQNRRLCLVFVLLVGTLVVLAFGHALR